MDLRAGEYAWNDLERGFIKSIGSGRFNNKARHLIPSTSP